VTTGTDRVAALVAPRLGALLRDASIRVIVAVTADDFALVADLASRQVPALPVPLFDVLRGAGRVALAALVAVREVLRPDVVLSFHNLAATRLTRARIVTTVHDVIPLEWGPPYIASGSKAEHVARARASLSRAAAVVAVSEASHRSTVAQLGAIAAPVFVAPNSSTLPRGDRDAALATGSPYALVHGGGEPRKDVSTAVRAWSALPAALRDRWRLVVVGGPWQGHEVPDGPDVIALGHIDDARYPRVLAGAALSIFPSRAEGFDIPLLDAMRFGVPVVASDIPAHREVGGEAIPYFRPGDALSLRERVEIELLKTDAERAATSENVARRACAFTPDRTVAGYFAAVHHALRSLRET
jgi:glycosyltransferase involved in cell wall biosynthesis